MPFDNAATGVTTTVTFVIGATVIIKLVAIVCPENGSGHCIGNNVRIYAPSLNKTYRTFPRDTMQ